MSTEHPRSSQWELAELVKGTSEAFSPFPSTAWSLPCALQPPPLRPLLLKTVWNVLGIRVAAVRSSESGVEPPAEPACWVACARGGVTVDARHVTLTGAHCYQQHKSVKIPGPRAGMSGKDRKWQCWERGLPLGLLSGAGRDDSVPLTCLWRAGAAT